MIEVKCDCGKLLTLRDSEAGRRIRCPDCRGPVDVPEPEEIFEAEEFAIADDDSEDFFEETGQRARPFREKPSRRVHHEEDVGPSPILIVGCAFFAMTLLIGLGVTLVIYGRNQAEEMAQDSPPVSQPAGATPAGAETPAAESPVGAASQGQLWVVLSNFQLQRSPDLFGETVSVDYRIVKGQPNRNQRYVLHVGRPSRGGAFEEFVEFTDFTLQNTGTIKFNLGPSFGLGTGKLRAFMGYRVGIREWEKVSGEVRPGETSAASPPPTIQELAGKAAEGKLVAIANATYSREPGGRQFSVDLFVQKQVEPGRRYYLKAVSASGEVEWEVDISHELWISQPGEKKTISASLLGGAGFGHSGSVTIHVEKRGLSPFRKEAPEVVSNRTVSK